MLQKIDGLIESYAKLIVTVADFMGIGKPLLITIWILLSGITWSLPSDSKGFSHLIPMCLIGGALMTPIQLLGAKFLHVAFSLLAEHGLPAPKLFPARLLAVFAALVTTFHLTGSSVLWLIVVVKLITPTLLWLYFFSCGGGSKYKAKEIAREMMRRLRGNFLPNPAPVPNPT